MNPIMTPCLRLLRSHSSLSLSSRFLWHARIVLQRNVRKMKSSKMAFLSRPAIMFSISVLTPSSIEVPSTERSSRMSSTFKYLLRSVSIVPRFIYLLVLWFPLLVLAIFSRTGLIEESTLIRVLRRSIEYSGPIFIKLGQWASSRRDLFPQHLCEALGRLQSNTRPHSYKYTQKVLRDNYGQDYMKTVFEDFQPEVLGSGCCAQVYKATLSRSSNEEEVQVAVKILHPNIQQQFDRDLRVMSSLVGLVLKLFPDMKWLSLQEGLEEFARLMQGQLDLRVELKHLEMFRRNFESNEQIVFPKAFPLLSSQNVLVETFEEGLHISAFLNSNSKDKGSNNEGDMKEEERIRIRRRLASIGVDMMLKMIFVDNLVHGDLHPGNILVRFNAPSNKKDEDRSEVQLVILDPGIVSKLSEIDLSNLAAVFRAVVKGETRRVGQLFLERSKHTCKTPEQFVKEMGQVVKEGLAQLRAGGVLASRRMEAAHLLNQVFNLLVRHEVKLESNFASIMLAIMVLEGLGRSLDPKIDLIAKAFPYVIRARDFHK